mgnify:CR=1 FL=1
MRQISQKKEAAVTFHDKSNVELVTLLSHKNGWVRDRAQQILITTQAKEVINLLKELAVMK